MHQEALCWTRTKKGSPSGGVCRKSEIMCARIFTGDLTGGSLKSAVKNLLISQGHFSRTDARQLKGLSPDHPAKKASLCSR